MVRDSRPITGATATGCSRRTAPIWSRAMARSRGAGCSRPRSRFATRIIDALLASRRGASYRSCNSSFERQAHERLHPCHGDRSTRWHRARRPDQARTLDPVAPGLPYRGRGNAAGRRNHQSLRQQLSRACRRCAPHRSGAGSAVEPRLRHGLGALHLRHLGSPQARWSSGWRHSSAPRTRSCIPPASTPMAGCSRRCSGAEDAVISDALNHASIIDGVRLCKAKRLRYANNDMADLEAQLERRGGCQRCG